jgi:hypothetical protein
MQFHADKFQWGIDRFFTAVLQGICDFGNDDKVETTNIKNISIDKKFIAVIFFLQNLSCDLPAACLSHFICMFELNTHKIMFVCVIVLMTAKYSYNGDFV